MCMLLSFVQTQSVPCTCYAASDCSNCDLLLYCGTPNASVAPLFTSSPCSQSKLVDNLDQVWSGQKHVSKWESPVLSMLCLAGELAEVTLQSLESLHGDSTAQWLYRLARGCDTEEVCTSQRSPIVNLHRRRRMMYISVNQLSCTDVPGLSESCIHQSTNQVTAAAMTRQSRLSLQQQDCTYVCQDALHVLSAETPAYASLLVRQMCI